MCCSINSSSSRPIVSTCRSAVEVVGGTAQLKDLGGRVVAKRKIAPFYFDYSEFPIDLKDVAVPVETEAAWASVHAAKPQDSRPATAPAEYELEVARLIRTIIELPRRRRKSSCWAINSLGFPMIGMSDKVIPPWTPMEWKDGEVSMWNKAYGMNGLGLADKVLNGGEPQLTSMKLLAIVNGHLIEIPHAKPVLKRKTDAGIDLAGETAVGGIRLNVATRVEFDGCVQNTMQLTGNWR